MVLYLGIIPRSKGIDFLIKSFAILVKMLCNVKLVLIGPDDGFLNEALSLSKTLGLASKILFTGFVSTEEKLEALVDADVFVTPSFYGVSNNLPRGMYSRSTHSYNKGKETM